MIRVMTEVTGERNHRKVTSVQSYSLYSHYDFTTIDLTHMHTQAHRQQHSSTAAHPIPFPTASLLSLKRTTL